MKSPAEIKAFFDGFKPTFPTEEQHREASAAWLAIIRPFLWENWPKYLQKLSFPTSLVELHRFDIDAIFSTDRREPNDEAGIDGLAFRITQAIQSTMPAGCFVKLSSRSAKDVWPDGKPPRCRVGREVVNWLASSERTIDDLVEYKYADAPCHLLLREYHEIPPEHEFRVFVQGGEIVGITQYHYDRYFPSIAKNREDIEWHVRFFVNDFITTWMPKQSDFVADVWVKSPLRNRHPALIELNPYGLSDPCCLTYADMSPPGRFAIVEAAK